jgi:hypothetical protein
MMLAMKKSFIDRTNYVRVSTTLILRCLKNKMQKHFKYFQYLKFAWQIVTNEKVQFNYLQGIFKK